MEAPSTIQIDNDNTQKQVWRSHTIAAVVFSTLLLAIFYETTWSMVDIWWRSETFAHGFLIFPISIWLIWGKRFELTSLNPTVEYKAIFALFGSGCLWLMGYLVDAQVIQQLSLILLLIAGAWVLLGNRAFWALSFPFAYLLFAVPMGEDLVPPLMELTATFTVEMVKLTGIPVYREGLFFSLPTGNWSVVEACSGVRYLIASITLGCLYAYLTYQSLKKRAVFIVFAIIVPIIANSIRAYIIVMLGHMSGMTLATGVDHLIYGWLFFGVVIFIMFAVGAKWRDGEENQTEIDAGGVINQQQYSPYKAGLIVLVVAGLWPMLALAMDSQQPAVPKTVLSSPNIHSWEITDQEEWQWRPLLLGADKRLDSFYQKQEKQILLSVGQYIVQQQGGEMVNTQNLLIHSDAKDWRITGTSKTTVRLQNRSFDVDSTHLAGPGRRLLVWSWYRVGDTYTANPYIAKLFEAVGKLAFSKQGGAKIVVAIEQNANESNNSQELQVFVNSILPKLEVALERVTDSIK